MIYVIGMSHMIPVLDACSVDGIGEQISKIANDSEPKFVNWDIKASVLPSLVKAASIYIRQIALHWGQVPAQMLSPSVVGVVSGFQQLLESIDPIEPDTVLFAFMYGEEYIHMSSRSYNAPHDFELPWRLDLTLARNRQIVPFEIIEKQVAQHLTKSIANFYAMRSLHPRLRIVNILCPPPSYSGDTGEVAQHFLRLKYYLLYAKVLQAAVTVLGVETLLPPSQTLTIDGSLASQYIGDGAHGNKLYGDLVTSQMRSLLLDGGI